MKKRPIAELEGPCHDLTLLLYLYDKGSVGIARMIEDGVASKGAIERILRDKLLTGYIELDTLSKIQGKPYKLTQKGKKIAKKLREIELLINQ
jgi:predicted transcriptional regulator